MNHGFRSEELDGDESMIIPPESSNEYKVTRTLKEC